MENGLPDSEQNVKFRKLSDARLKALKDNTAQGIYNYLNDVENKRELYEKRWIWELLQNALDSAPDGGKIDVRVVRSGNYLKFSHNGRPFKIEEVAHLIYHGSTKKEFDIGKFGTGFLVTHLISKQVEVEGVQEDKNKFSFKLDRSGTSADAIERLMEKTWDDYQNSLTEIKGSSQYTAEYRYTIDESSLRTADEGIETLAKIAPYVLAFNQGLGNIEITTQNSKRTFRLSGENRNDGITVKLISEEQEDQKPRIHELRIAEKDGLAVVLKLQDYGNGKQVDDIRDVPKIFISFPLFATQDLPYSAVLNSRKFEPTEKRDGIFLGKEETSLIRQNKQIMQDANLLFKALLVDLINVGCQNLHLLLRVGKPPVKDWLTETDQDWYIGLLSSLIKSVLDLKIVRTEDNSFISVKEAVFPDVDDSKEDALERLWAILRQISSYRSVLPAKTTAHDWKEILTNWKSLEPNLLLNEVTIGELASTIEKCGTLNDFQKKLSESGNDFKVLNEFYRLLYEVGQQSLLENYKIVVNQNNLFTKKGGLLRDTGIDDQMKDISKKLGKEIRSQLIHLNVDEVVQESVPPKEQLDLLREILTLVRDIKLKNPSYREANADLFNWLMEHGEHLKLEGFPMLSLAEDKAITLLKSNIEKPLSPKEVWDESSRNYWELFPEELIISSAYLRKDWKREYWMKLFEEGFVLINPLFEGTDVVSQDDFNLLLTPGQKLDESNAHGTKSPIAVSKIAYIKTPENKSIMDTVRKSKEKNRRLLDFLFKYVVESDNHWNTPSEVECVCGERHKIYSALWLAPLKDRSWVWVRRDKAEKPSAHFLAPIVDEDAQLIQSCRMEKPVRLLSILGVSVSELMIQVISKNEQSKLTMESAVGSLYSTYMTTPDTLSKIAQLAENEPQLFVTEIEARLLERERIRNNQKVGALVEALMKSNLEKEGLNVVRTGVGSDYSVENDLVEGNQELVFEIKEGDNPIFYVEIKATHVNYAKMTFTQVKHARDNPQNHVLCVVELMAQTPTEETVRAGAKFVMNIGERVRDKVSEVEGLQTQQGKVISSTGDIGVEFTEGSIRFVVNEPVWRSGKTFDEFLIQVKK